MKEITVFTPTYNRAYTLPTLYESLKTQTVQNFEWLIVDDGSTDNTKDLVESWSAENIVDIRYIYQENGGKMKAHNLGARETQTELFLCVDSDDWLVRDAIESIIQQWALLSKKKKTDVAGLVAYRGKNSHEVIGTAFPEGVVEESLGGLYNEGFSGDTALVFRTEIIKSFAFPIIGSEKFITEAYVYDQIDRLYNLHLMRKIIIICEYRSDGLTKNQDLLVFNNPCGYTAYYIQKGNFTTSFIKAFKYYVRANVFRNRIGKTTLPVCANHKFIYQLAYPFGCALYFYKRLKCYYDKIE